MASGHIQLCRFIGLYYVAVRQVVAVRKREDEPLIIVYRKWAERLRYLLLFILLSMFLYHMMAWVAPLIEPSQKYREPSGRAVKVFQSKVLGNEGTFTERLRFFYWFGGE
jgi:hypothetical protein